MEYELLEKLLEDCTVRVVTKGQSGSGFFVAPGLILTCTHVIKNTLGEASAIKVHHHGILLPVLEITKAFPLPYPDLALLRIIGLDHPCVYLDENISPYDPLYSYGYTDDHPDGESLTVESEGWVRLGIDQDLIKLKEGQVKPGASGSPLLNRRTGNVCGVIKFTRDKNIDMGGGAISGKAIYICFPELIELQRSFHQKDRGWGLARAQAIIPKRAPRKFDVVVYETVGNIHKPEKLFGRDHLVSQVNKLLEKPGRVLLFGLAGAGKTALAATIADQWINDGKGPVIWLDIGEGKREIIFDAIFQRFAKEEERENIARLVGDSELMAAKELLVRSKAGLLVLDNVWNGQTLGSILEAVPEALPILVTSREKFPRIERIEVGDLPKIEALRFLKFYARRGGFSNAEAGRLARLLGYHAYALEIASAMLEVDDFLIPDRLYEQIASAPDNIQLTGVGEEGRESVRKLLERSYQSLSSEMRQALSVFGALSQPGATANFIACILKHDLVTVEIELKELARRSLITQSSDNFYSIHDLTFSFARSKYKEMSRRSYPVASVVRHYLTDYAHNYNVLELDLANILGIAEEARNKESLLRIVSILTIGGYPKPAGRSYLDERGHTLLLLEKLEQAIRIAREMKPVPGETLHYLVSKQGNAAFNRGNYDKALQAYQEALSLTESEERIIIAHGAIGKVLSFLNRIEEARLHFDEGYRLAREKDNDYLYSFVLEQESHAAGHNQDYETALRISFKYVEIAEKLVKTNPNPEYKEKLFYSSLNLGSAELDLGKQDQQHLAKALKAHLRASQIADELEDLKPKAYVYSALAEDYHYNGDRRKAREYAGKALKLWRRLGMTKDEMEILQFMKENGYIITKSEEENEGNEL
jgi:tetratricopeptide (TPR) repeat protein